MKKTLMFISIAVFIVIALATEGAVRSIAELCAFTIIVLAKCQPREG